MIELSTSGPHTLEYRGDTHAYFLDGKQVFGVTTANKRGYPTSEQLISWTAGMAAEYTAEKLVALVKGKQRITKAKVGEIVKASKNAGKTAMGDAADIGTIVHDYAYHTESGKHYDMDKWKDHKDLKRIQAAIRAFNAWKSGNHDKPVALEALVASPEHQFAGRIDRLAERGSQLVLSDYKTSTGFYVTQFIQAAGYRLCVWEWLGKKVNLLEIIRLDKYKGKIETKTSADLAAVYGIRHEDLLAALTDQFLRNLDTAKFRLKYEGDK